jgi:hypothetical protein
MLESTNIWDIKPMSLQDAIAYVEAGRLNYNKNCPEDRQNFRQTVEMMEECHGNCGTDEDAACLNALGKDYQKALKQFEKAYIQQLVQQVDRNRVKEMRADPELFNC